MSCRGKATIGGTGDSKRALGQRGGCRERRRSKGQCWNNMHIITHWFARMSQANSCAIYYRSNFYIAGKQRRRYYGIYDVQVSQTRQLSLSHDIIKIYRSPVSFQFTLVSVSATPNHTFHARDVNVLLTEWLENSYPVSTRNMYQTTMKKLYSESIHTPTDDTHRCNRPVEVQFQWVWMDDRHWSLSSWSHKWKRSRRRTDNTSTTSDCWNLYSNPTWKIQRLKRLA